MSTAGASQADAASVSPARERGAAAVDVHAPDGTPVGVRVVVDDRVTAKHVVDGRIPGLRSEPCTAGAPRRRAPLVEKCKPGLASSVLPPTAHRVVESTNGFVTAVMAAYNNHLPLRLKPDDIFINVLQSVSGYIVKNAERCGPVEKKTRNRKCLLRVFLTPFRCRTW